MHFRKAMGSFDAVTPGWPTAKSGHVPERYFGVWSRTLLETPDTRDTTTLVRWMQLGMWHADLRTTQVADGQLSGFCGTTRVTQVNHKEMCTWQRVVDYQPPRGSADEGWIVFETEDRLVETGIHGVYREVWERLPGSVGRCIALAEPARSDGMCSARLFVSGDYMMRVRPTEPLGAEFEISFGKHTNENFTIESSTQKHLTNSSLSLRYTRINEASAVVAFANEESFWQVLEWVED